MPATLEFDAQQHVSGPSFAQQLRDQMAGVRVMKRALGIRRSLSRGLVNEAATVFHAEGQMLSASKKLLDTTNEKYRAVVGILAQASVYWHAATIAFPVPGIRLINRGRIATFAATMEQYRSDLNMAVAALNADWATIREAAKTALGTLFSEADYPLSVSGEFELAWDFPSVEPPEYMKQFPELYEAERQKIAKKFEAAIEKAEEALMLELSELVAHLVERLQPGEDGRRKVLCKSSVENFTMFFSRFKELNVSNNGDLNALVEQAEAIVGGADVADLRKDGSLRAHLSDQLSKVKDQLDECIAAKPSRAFDFDM